MSIAEWYNSEPMQAARQRMFSDRPWDFCSRCYHEESVSNTSRRNRSNQKSVLFVENFKESFQQSPGYKKFTQVNGEHHDLPIDLHIDLGNYCNLACKMCNPSASSQIATQHVKWQLIKSVPQDWTQDTVTWNRFLKEVAEIPKLKNIHFMGGETLIQPRFKEFVDYLITNNRTDVCLSLVTNGTVLDLELIRKLKKFTRLGLEVSIETVSESNDYTRQGTNTQAVIDNIRQYMKECNGTNITLTLRPAPSALTVRDYWQLIEFALNEKLLIKGNLCTTPEFLDITVLPYAVRQQYRTNYISLLQKYQLDGVDVPADYNESDPSNYKLVAKKHVNLILNILDQADSHRQSLLPELCKHLSMWDQVYKYDARLVYPELADILNANGYHI